MLASCGGGDSGGTPPPTGGGGGGGTPTPSPSPTPTYQTFAQLTGNQTFRTTCAGTTFTISSGLVTAAATPFGAGVTIGSNRDVPNYAITTDGAGLFGTFQQNWAPADRDPAITTAEAYSRVNANNFTERFLTLSPLLGTSTYQYARFGQIITQVNGDRVSLYCGFGVPTLLTDRPNTSVTFTNNFTAGDLSVTQNLGGGPRSDYVISSSQITLTGNPSTGAITVRVDLKGRLRTPTGTSDTVTDLGVFTGQVSIDGTTQSFSGTLVDASNGSSGQFGGWFFGPQGREAVVSFNIVNRRADNSDILAGAVTFLNRPS
ncbi:hypothetical protein [Porphyrobacter sp. YT40]|uniref:hypothetical protein n=1 Tax=Porphyrobacter sp. YT40 TaxID=2547601 RepID=UPI001141DCDE|nr:hypothetical protein [Porphyrobacter sp. YT40]QDH35214.1 hypothetical protein E2E27_13330 [Porphyrobacter sp. YT40]